MIDPKTGKKKTGYLRNLRLKELSGVDRPANPGAFVVLHKRADGTTEVKKVYASNAELPDAIKALPDAAQSVFRKVVNDLLEKDTGEESAFKQAWAAVKQGWEKRDGQWVKKRDFSEEERSDLADEGDALPDGSYPIKTTGDLENAISAFGRAKDKAKVKAHIIRRARALGATDKLPEDWTAAEKRLDQFAKDFLGYSSPAIDAGGDKHGAQSFNDLLAENEERRERGQISDQLWPLFCALQDSINSIVADENVTPDQRLPFIRQSIEQFMTALPDGLSQVDAEEQMEKFLTHVLAPAAKANTAGNKTAGHDEDEEDEDMTDKEAEALKARVADLTKQVTDLTKALNDANAKVETLTTEKAAAVAKAEDEVIKIDDKTEIRKSVVGAAQFEIFKAQQERIQKAEEARELSLLEKRAETELPGLPGEPAAKAKVLKALAAMPEEQRTELDKMLKAGSAALAGMMKAKGTDGSGGAVDMAGRLEEGVQKYMTDNKVTDYNKAYSAFLDTEVGKKLYREAEEEKRQRAA